MWKTVGLWFYVLSVLFETKANIYAKLESGIDDFKTVDLRDMFNYPTDRKKSVKKTRHNKFELRFDPASLKQVSNFPGAEFPADQFPADQFPEFNVEDFGLGVSNGSQNFPSVPQNIPQSTSSSFPSSTNTPQIGQIPPFNLNNTLGNTPTSIFPTSVNIGTQPLPPNVPAGQINPGFNVPNQIGPGVLSGLPNLRPGLNRRPGFQTAAFPNGPFQPVTAFQPQLGLGNNVVDVTSRPQRFQDMLALMGNRVKNLIFGAAPAFVKRPENSRGFLNLFDVIKFKNTPCIGTINRIRTVNGTCFYKSQCEERGGIISGTCAEGYGVCCVFRYGCGSQTAAEISYLESPNYPLASTEPLTCAFAIQLLPYVRQVRLDLLFFELRQPVAGNCIEDQFIVSGQNKNSRVPVLCGINSGQHMYIDVDAAPERRLLLSIVGRSSGARAFSIRILQLHYNLAPRNCLQYHTELTGYIKSFNYDDIGNIVEGRRASYFNNLNYAICIERAPDRCDITFTNQVAEGELQFQLFNVNEQFIPTVPQNQAGAEVFNCPGDYLAFNSLRLCGDKLNDGSVSQNFNQNAPITDYGAGPIVIPFQTDEAIVGRGFKVIYYQESCD